ncbi:hypothetical protein R3I93_015802 [Phoxinus phoxinus]|uniref:Uncharacterized protein n=1 Tax=Phoxinus phoxinus TaxID=58324 RepID=A0AAN9CLZ5_9TELE
MVWVSSVRMIIWSHTSGVWRSSGVTHLVCGDRLESHIWCVEIVWSHTSGVWRSSGVTHLVCGDRLTHLVCGDRLTHLVCGDRLESHIWCVEIVSHIWCVEIVWSHTSGVWRSSGVTHLVCGDRTGTAGPLLGRRARAVSSPAALGDRAPRAQAARRPGAVDSGSTTAGMETHSTSAESIDLYFLLNLQFLQ